MSGLGGDKAYTLEFQEGHGFRSEPDSYNFRAYTDDIALGIAKKVLGISPEKPMTSAQFFTAGGKRLLCEGVQVFPRPELSEEERLARQEDPTFPY
jgi:hypothetical protein